MGFIQYNYVAPDERVCSELSSYPCRHTHISSCIVVRFFIPPCRCGDISITVFPSRLSFKGRVRYYMRNDGLNNLQYSKVDISLLSLYTHIMADIKGNPPYSIGVNVS